MAEFEALGFAATASTRSVTGIRFETGIDPRVTKLDCYLEGRVEVQDDSSQLAVEFSEARAGEVVVDLASGAGGKALALAAQMRNQGSIIACDVDDERLSRTSPRALRAGATIIRLAGDPYAASVRARLPQLADLVFVDAPCSGSGTWRRNPEAKWNLTPDMLIRYREAQSRLLERAGELVGASGRIVYAVCSVLPAEGELQVQRFCELNPGWRVAKRLELTPARDQTDGFFAAMLCRAGQ
jgi:16S rRNA (cytosine967-C5)-methyltransferase